MVQFTLGVQIAVWAYSDFPPFGGFLQSITGAIRLIGGRCITTLQMLYPASQYYESRHTHSNGGLSIWVQHKHYDWATD